MVGLATRLEGSVVYAFDTDPTAQLLCAKMARLNKVSDRVRVRGYCDPNTLNALLQGRSLLICDCEGYESELLQPELVPQLKNCDIVVELHDVYVPGVTSLIQDRFAASHSVRLLTSPEQRNPADYPTLHFLPEPQQWLALSEGRGSMTWAFLQARRD